MRPKLAENKPARCITAKLNISVPRGRLGRSGVRYVCVYISFFVFFFVEVLVQNDLSAVILCSFVPDRRCVCVCVLVMLLSCRFTLFYINQKCWRGSHRRRRRIRRRRRRRRVRMWRSLCSSHRNKGSICL